MGLKFLPRDGGYVFDSAHPTFVKLAIGCSHNNNEDKELHHFLQNVTFSSKFGRYITTIKHRMQDFLSYRKDRLSSRATGAEARRQPYQHSF